MDNSQRSTPFWHSLRRHQGRIGVPPTHQPPSSSSPPPAPILINPVPIHEQPLAVNPQNDSPLYNGRIPPEIRNQIFTYALTEYTKTDPESQYLKSTNYTRPGYTGKRTITAALLQTCRRTYRETYHLPPVSKEHVFWHARWPPGRTTSRYAEHEARYFERLQPWQLSLVKEIHLFTQLFWLEGSFLRLCCQPFMQGIEKVKITIRRGDWWWNESNHLLGINPQRGNGEAKQMHDDWRREKEGNVLHWNPNGWGCAFSRLPSLKELEMEFETSDDKKDELMAIVEKAKTWEFPLTLPPPKSPHERSESGQEGEIEGKTKLVLSTEGLEPKISTWQSSMCYWSERCPNCHATRDCMKVDPPNAKCTERMRLRGLDLGPLCYVVSLRWRVKKIEEDR